MAYTVNCSILLTELPLLERPAAAKKAGFDNVEFWWPFAEAVPADAEVEKFVSSLADAGVQLTGLNFLAGEMPAGDRGIVSWIGREKEFADNIDVVAAIGQATGCRGFNALYGNRQDGQSAAEQDELALANLVAAARGVAKIDGTVLLEPVSGTEAYPLKTAADALGVIAKTQEAGVDNVKLLADFYHMAVNGDDVADVVNKHAADFGHIQIADDPGRGAPGTGNLPLGEWIESSRAKGYTGPIGLEYKASSDVAFDWLIRQGA
ncbi:MAG: hydroxypyruvate isomerase family protein [Arthrobacter sp.]|uniref:hydroxypyruvate isomerase family protein n=1 Tax=unclassified Arthrobacter TaxID=235627 RepID=UPI00264D61AC|nr:TIM barrel protein [Micrococcaceae bacterium]MDN5812755.1 TIM barrel protein [Micrococcaceae bacterium]MDN5823622.1 TIM barrel protein [Micrococcaceae bacterium]MDN5879701.1 TIM barrel protein [Micrococcaceae bacterium]MDN5887621.1 TIM barrel protein [Micrococcaceae bacterium]